MSKRRQTFLPLLLAFCAACSTDSCSCEGFEQRPFPSTKQSVTIPQSGQVRVTRAGLDYIENQIPFVMTQFLPDGLSFCIPRDTSGNPDLCIDSTCTGGANGCQVDLVLADQNLATVPPRTVRADITIGGVNERLNFDYDAGLFTVNCYVQLFKKGSSESTAAQVGASVPVDLVVDQAAPMKDLGIALGQVTLDLNDVDFKIHGRGNIGDTITCEGASLVRGLFRDRIENEIRAALDDAVDDISRANLCRHCGNGLDDCPNGSTCANDGVCDYTAATCVPRTLGVEGRLRIGSLLGDFVREPGAAVDVLAKAADLGRVDTGITAGLRSGFEPQSVADCIPVDPNLRPSLAGVPESATLASDRKPDGSPFQFGVALHKRPIEQLLWSAWASGATCLEISDRNVMILNTTAFSLIAPSMKDLAGPGKAAVLSIVATKHPTVTLGSNQINQQGDTYVIADPLLRIVWEDVDFHVFAFAQDRFTRMFTLRLDIDLPVAVVPDGAGNLIPVIADIESAIADIEPRRLELLTEEPDKIIDVVPTLLSLAAPQLAGNIPEAIALPEFFGFRLSLRAGDITSVDQNEFVAVFADLARAGAPLRLAAETAVISHTTKFDRVLPSGLVRPEIHLRVHGHEGDPTALGIPEMEYSWRVDRGLWSLPVRSSSLVVDDPILALQGRHVVEVRAQHVGAPGSADPTPASFEVLIDLEPPSVSARTEAGGDLVLDGFDLADDELEYRIELPDGSWSHWSTRNEFAALDPGVTRWQARDDSGQVTSGEAGRRQPVAPSVAATGCNAAGGGPSGAAVLLGLLAFFCGPRRRRWLVAATVAAAALSGCKGCRGELRTNAQDYCYGPGCNVERECSLDSDCNDLCPEGSSGICEADSCTCVKACAGGCAEGAFCCLSTDQCAEFGDACGAMPCDVGYEPGVQTATPNRETCQLEDVVCECIPLPPVPIGWHGQYTDIDSDGTTTVVTTYNKEYGDLMLGVVGPDLSVAWTFVDGVPSDGAVVGDPGGPRGGLAERGPHVGTHTAVWVDGSAAHVAYRDEDEDTLKYGRAAIQGDQVTFESATIDDAGDVGYWPSIVVESGSVHVVYSAADVGGQTQMRHVTFNASAAVAGLTVDPMVVLSTPTAESGKSFMQVVSAHHDLSLAPDGLFVVFWNAIDDRVGRMRFTAGTWTEPAYLAFETGPYAAGVVDEDGLEHVVFMLGSGLRYSRFGDTATSLIDDGTRDDGVEYFKGRIGENAQIRLDSGALSVAFHDAFDRSLRLATSADGASWAKETVLAPGTGGGFWTAMTRRGPRLVADMVVERTNDPQARVVVTSLD